MNDHHHDGRLRRTVDSRRVGLHLGGRLRRTVDSRRVGLHLVGRFHRSGGLHLDGRLRRSVDLHLVGCLHRSDDLRLVGHLYRDHPEAHQACCLVVPRTCCILCGRRSSGCCTLDKSSHQAAARPSRFLGSGSDLVRLGGHRGLDRGRWIGTGRVLLVGRLDRGHGRFGTVLRVEPGC